MVSNCLGRTASFTQGKVSNYLVGIASFLGRKVSNCWRRVKGGTWLTACWNSLGRTASFTWGKVSSCWGRIASFPGRKVSNCWRRVRGDAWLLTGVELMAWEGLPPSLEGRRAPAWLLVWGVLLLSPGGEVLACLTDWEPKLLDGMRFVALALVTFPSFLWIRILNLFNCLCLTLVNLISLTLLMKPWHSRKSFCWNNRS